MTSAMSSFSKTEDLVVLTPIEKILIGIGKHPWDLLYRAAAGFFAATVAARSDVLAHPKSIYVGVILLVLFLLRFVPAVLRRLMPVSDTVRGIWAMRRHVSKYYDSYQWCKLFGFGIGVALHSFAIQGWRPLEAAVASICVLSGSLGMFRWRITQRDQRIQLQ